MSNTNNFGPYIVRSCIGRGRNGTVYLAEGPGRVSRDEVALKLVMSHDPEKLRREVEIWKRIGETDHPNILKFYNSFTNQDKLVIICEYACNGSLKGWITQYGDLQRPLTQIRKFMMGILGGLGCMHDLGYIHRDLNPTNILLNRDLPLIADFGLAREVPRGGRIDDGHVVGNPFHLAPESWEGCYTPSSDMWSFGVTLYRMLTGYFPFHGDSVKDLRTAILETEYRTLPKEIPIDYANMITLLLRKNPRERLSSARQAAEVLRSFAE